ncbi:MAG: glycogen synthase GlgA [Puniceicoccales bacterium]|jgi:starch synthase|nr:glycogen synthase GlgA [Puniceicoccales bacterium]
MKILMASPECYPYATVGGLGDVMGALPMYLNQLGHDVRVCLPLYGSIQPQDSWKAYDNVVVHLGEHERICRIWEHVNRAIVYYFIEYQQYFGRYEIYEGPWGPHFDNGERFAFFSRAVLDLCYSLKWYPDVLHCHDWTTGLIPVYINTRECNQKLNRAATVFTIHNLEHQGVFAPDILAYAGIPFSEYRCDSLESMGAVNFMKGALFHATKLTTVSPNYAREIQTHVGGCGLHPVLKFKAGDLIGILNGIDETLWNPSTDTWLPATYTADNLTGKGICKQHLQRYFSLKIDPHVPVYGVVSRLYFQKGLDILLDILPSLLSRLRIQMVVLGNGEVSWEQRFCEIAGQYPQQLGVYIGFDTSLAHLIEAGSDLFVMPSRFEPCGLNQMYSMRYGTLPIVRNTGGLADTVHSLDETTGKGTGFAFNELTHDALWNTIGWACATYYDRPQTFASMQQQAMHTDFSWNKAAKAYEQVYQWAIQARQKCVR